MKFCTYTLYEEKNKDGKTIAEDMSYEQLVNKLIEKKTSLSLTDDYLYDAATNPKQVKIREELKNIKETRIVEQKGDKNLIGMSAEQTFNGVDNLKTFTLQGFADSAHYVKPNGERYCVPLVRKDYQTYLVNFFEGKESMSHKDAEAKAKLIVDGWDKIAEDSAILHEILGGGKYQEQLGNIDIRLKNTRLEGLTSMIKDEILHKGSGNSVVDELYGGTFGNKVIKNILMKCKTRGIDLDLLGHIDNIIISPTGFVQIVNYKISANTIDPDAIPKYKHEMALLKQMVISELADHGIGVNTDSVSVSIIPIYVKYNDDLTKATNITVGKKMRLDVDDRNRYIFDEFDKAAQRYINPKCTIEKLTTTEEQEIKKHLGLILPKQNVTTQGIALTADMWIKRNIGTNILKITGKKGVYYQVTFPDGTKKDITDYHSPLINKEIKDLVQKRLADLSIGNSYITARRIAETINQGLNSKYGNFTFSGIPEYRGCDKYFDKMFKPYFSGVYDKETKKFTPDWEIIPDDILFSQNIILFRNKNTHQLDVVTISPYDLDETAQFRGGYQNILGQFIGDNEARQRGIIKGTFGNIEMLRTMMSLNTVINKIQGEFQLGKLFIISPESLGSSTIYTFKNAIKNFTRIIESVRKEEPDNFTLINNFKNVKFHDSLEVFLTLAEQAEANLQRKIAEDWIEANTDDKATLREIFGDPMLSNEAKFEMLKNIMKSMEIEFGFDAFDKIDYYENKDKVALYKSVGEAVLQYSRLDTEIDYNEDDKSNVELNFQGSANISSKNVKIITGLFAQTADTIAERAYKRTRQIQKYLDEYYKACGYSNTRNSTIGDQQRVFRKLFDVDENGNKIMRFRNPFTDPTLKDHERKLIKQVAFTLAQVRSKMFPNNKDALFTFKSWNDPGIQEFIEKQNWYLEVPLMRASKATARTTGYTIREWKDRMLNIFSGEQLYKNFQELVDNIYGEDEKKMIDDDFSQLSITNRYGWYESLNSEAARQNALTRDPDFFETNVETMVMNFITGQEQAEEMSNFMVKTKAVLLTLNGIGNPGSPKLKNTIKYILDFLSINVYNRSILEDASKKVVSVITPAKHLATSVYILGNFASMVRDIVEGVLQNFTRACIKFQTNISKENLTKAYGIVVRDGTFSNVRSLNLLNQLNIKYRISNVDVARIEEVLASGRGGIVNYQNWLYATLRRPDFMNRMTLFVAKMLQDGVWNAMFIDEEGNLKYNWKLDERFSYYAEYKDKGNVPDMEKFLEQKGAYYSAIMEYNQEHTSNPLNMQDPNVALPDPYTNAYVESIKSVGHSIYGSYDKSTRSRWEFMATGQALGQFTTWMNGMIGNYFRKPGSETGEMKLDYQTNELGERLFLDEFQNIVVERRRENGEIYYFNEDSQQEVSGQVLPIKKNIPVLSQGIIYSVLHLFKRVVPAGLERYEKEGLQGLINEINKEILNNPEELKNFKKLLSDIFINLFLSGLFEFVVDPTYKDLVKNRNKKELLVNSLEDILYKGTASSYDGFKGPLNIIQTYGNNNPPAYKVTTKMMTDITKTVIGKKTLGQLLTQNVPVLRSFRTAYEAYAK